MDEPRPRKSLFERMSEIARSCPPHSWADAPTVGSFHCSNCDERVDHDDPRFAGIKAERDATIAAARASFEEDHSVGPSREGGSVKRSHRTEGRNYVD